MVRETEGRAFIDGRLVATVMLREEYVSDLVRIPLPGTGTDDIVDRGRWQQAYLWLANIDEQLRLRLQGLIALASASVQQRRAARDSNSTAVGLQIALDDGRQLPMASLSSPFETSGVAEDTAFPVSFAE